MLLLRSLQFLMHKKMSKDSTTSNNKNTDEFMLNDQLHFQSNSLYNMDIAINIQGRVNISKLDNIQ